MELNALREQCVLAVENSYRDPTSSGSCKENQRDAKGENSKSTNVTFLVWIAQYEYQINKKIHIVTPTFLAHWASKFHSPELDESSPAVGSDQLFQDNPETVAGHMFFCELKAEFNGR